MLCTPRSLPLHSHPMSTKAVYELFNAPHDGPDFLFIGPTDRCMCGGEIFHALVWFGDDREIAGRFTEMICATCGALVRGQTNDPRELER